VSISNSRLVLDRVGLELLELDKRTLLQLAVVYDVVCLLGKHALNEVDSVVEDNTESLDTRRRVVHGLDLNALHDGILDLLASKDAAKTACCDGVHGVGHREVSICLLVESLIGVYVVDRFVELFYCKRR